MLQINFSNSFDKTKSFTVNGYVVFQFYPWFKFNSPFFKLIIIHYHTQRKITFKQRTKLNHNSYNTHVI